MDAIQAYNSASSDSSENETFTENQFRSIYLITYSQADLARFPTREEFAHAVVKSFSTGKANVVQWVCCRESHQTKGEHYHMAVKLDRNQRWIMSKRFLIEEEGISVNYSDRHHNYYSAWLYVTKEDREYLESDSHPDLRGLGQPRTDVASRRRRSDRREHDDDDLEQGAASSTAPPKKRKRLTSFEVSEIVVEKRLKTVAELQALAHQQKVNGKTDLAEFIVSRSPRVVAGKEGREGASAVIERSRKSRMQLLQEAGETDCVEGCNGQWRICAEEVLSNNRIPVRIFGDAVKELLTKGRGKNRNILLTGSTNCGKTFLLNPLKIIYNTFCNPATGSFAWVGVDEVECIFLNDFRWSAQIIPWHDLLLLLEGDIVHLPAPKSHFAKDICLQKDTPVLATGKGPIVYVKSGIVDQQETDMMFSRWRIFQLYHQIPGESQRDIPSCPKCFYNLLFSC